MNEGLHMWKPLEEPTKSESVDPEHVGVDPRFVLSSHFQLMLPGTHHVDPATGTKAWSEPVLVLFVSVDHPDWSSSQLHVLYYGLSRRSFSSGLDPRTGDRAKLMAAARPLLKADIERIGSSDVPDSLPKMKYV